MKKTTVSLLLLTSILTILSSCVTLKNKTTNDLIVKSILESNILSSHFTGFALFDPIDSSYLADINGDKLFTPSSNTKLLTFYAGLKMLGDSIPGLKYEIKSDTLFFTGTGDPTFLHWRFENQRAYDFLNDSTKTLVYVHTPFEDEILGGGWSWEDYEFYYQVERNGFPIYGNAVGFEYDRNSNHFETVPDFFDDFVEIRNPTEFSTEPNRLVDFNIFTFAPDTTLSRYKNQVPFKTSEELLLVLLEDTLHRSIAKSAYYDWHEPKILYSQPAGDVYAYMLKVSDNFYAEQIHYMCAVATGLPMHSDHTRKHIQDNFFKKNNFRPIWEDGSGLSRYNLMSPKMLVAVMTLIAKEINLETFKQSLAIGGVDGSLTDWYKSEAGQTPYIYAKSGTHRNNHSLTGIILTKSGRHLFFSFMNNNYASGSYAVKLEMEKTLRLIYENY